MNFKSSRELILQVIEENKGITANKETKEIYIQENDILPELTFNPVLYFGGEIKEVHYLNLNNETTEIKNIIESLNLEEDNYVFYFEMQKKPVLLYYTTDEKSFASVSLDFIADKEEVTNVAIDFNSEVKTAITLNKIEFMSEYLSSIKPNEGILWIDNKKHIFMEKQ